MCTSPNSILWGDMDSPAINTGIPPVKQISKVEPQEEWNDGTQLRSVGLRKHFHAGCLGLTPVSCLDKQCCSQKTPCKKWVHSEWTPQGTFKATSIFFAFHLKVGQLRSPIALYWWHKQSPLWLQILGPSSGSNLWLSPHSVRDGAKLALTWGLQYGNQSGQTDVPSKSVS